mmetsp:Transcript_64935/g.164476  ORF Transcript_64935/g.164476 Transcript_64935/m.164476 type:complete len:213 (-) Transcript_64935:1-639(-)
MRCPRCAVAAPLAMAYGMESDSRGMPSMAAALAETWPQHVRGWVRCPERRAPLGCTSRPRFGRVWNPHQRRMPMSTTHSEFVSHSRSAPGRYPRRQHPDTAAAAAAHGEGQRGGPPQRRGHGVRRERSEHKLQPCCSPGAPCQSCELATGLACAIHVQALGRHGSAGGRQVACHDSPPCWSSSSQCCLERVPERRAATDQVRAGRSQGVRCP